MTSQAARRHTGDFHYDYPANAIAQRPLEDRAASRLLTVDRTGGPVQHRHMRDLPSFVHSDDTVIVNASRVVPARLTGTRENGRDAEVLLVHANPDGSWMAMVHPGGKLKVGRTVRFGDDALATIAEVQSGGVRRLTFEGRMTPRALMDTYGETPLPPYIRRKPDAVDSERYQTVFARVEGSVAAPTAGLHFTPELLDAIRARGATICEVVLHIGPGTFKPVATEVLTDHVMHAEWYEIPDATAKTVQATQRRGGRVWAIGTTAVRALESAARDQASFTARSGWTDLFIYPPYDFKVVDAMVTNFHLPRSTLLMLVAAFGGYESVMSAYRTAVQAGYRLYSYGDAMAIL